MTEYEQQALLYLCRLCAAEGGTIAQINALMPKLIAGAKVMAAETPEAYAAAWAELEMVQANVSSRVH